MLVPIWSATWEIDCCQPEAEVGERWSVPIGFVPKPLPWWMPDDTPVTAPLTYGSITLTVKRLTPLDDQRAVFTSGALRFRGPAELEDGEHTGRLVVDAHVDDEPTSVEGVVTRVELVPIRYELSGRVYQPVDQLAHQEARSTTERSRFETPDEGKPSIGCELLVWLEVDS